jgi:uncharacterized protein (DUF488 family)
MSTIYTIGYEGTDIDRFASTLVAVGIDLLVDVRAIAASRKKGFSKTALRERLGSEGIGYLHLVELGDPKSGREAAREGRIAEFRRIYKKHLTRKESTESLRDLLELARTKSVCLLCYERDPKHCHRSILTAHLVRNGLNHFDLYGDLPRRYDNFTAQITRRYSRESTTTA